MEIPEATSLVRQGVDDAVEAAARRVGDSMTKTEKARQMTRGHVRHLDDGPQATLYAPDILPGEVPLRAHGIRMPPEPAELLDRSTPCGLQAVPPNDREPASLSGREIGLVEEPELARPFELIVVFGSESPVFGSSHVIGLLSQVIGDMELVLHGLRVRGLACHCVGVGIQHVGGHGPDLLPLLERQCLEHCFCGGLSSLGATSRTREP